MSPIIKMAGVLLFIAGCLGCGSYHSPSHDLPATEVTRTHPDQRVEAFVAWLERKGVTLEPTEAPRSRSRFSEWKVTHPQSDAHFEILFSIRSFPDATSEQEMNDAVREINLAYMINASARLAMCHGCISGVHSDDRLPSDAGLPKLNGVPVTKAIQALFREYKPE